MISIPDSPAAAKFSLSIEIQIDAATYIKLRELMIERNKLPEFEAWHRGKLIIFKENK